MESLCDRVGILRDGRLVDEGSLDQLFSSPQHQYTRALLDAASELPTGATGPAA